MHHIYMVRARYGTGVFLKLNKRECNIRIRLTPCSGDFQKIQLSIGGDRHTFWPSAACGGQFFDLVTAVYCLYSEGSDDHTNCRRRIHKYRHDWAGGTNAHTITCEVMWDGEGPYYTISLVRRNTNYKEPTPDEYDPIDIEIKNKETYRYTVDGKDLCYAIAKAATQALKKYGFRGYYISSGSICCLGDPVNIEQLLFIKAYALNALETRQLKTVWRNPNSWMNPEGTSFEQEMELLLFDM